MGKHVYRRRLIIFMICIFLLVTHSIVIHKINRRLRSRASLGNLYGTYKVILGSAFSDNFNVPYQVNSGDISDKVNATYLVNSGAISGKLNLHLNVNTNLTSDNQNAPYRANSSVILEKLNLPYRVNSSALLNNSKASYPVNSSTFSGKVNVTYQVKIRPNLLKLINSSEPKYPVNVDYVYENETFCSSVENLTLLVIVLSSVRNFNRRQMIRQSWGNESLFTSYGTLKVLFLLGIVENVNVQIEIVKEFKLYGDMVQGAFKDTYHNLTHKSIMGFKWATERCRNAKYVLKTDDDVVLNMFKLFQSNFFNEYENKFHIYCRRQSTPIYRYEKSKWFVGQDQFKGLTRYPTYCGGSFVLMLNKVVPFIYKSVLRTPFFWIEDVLLYGVALNNIPGLEYKIIRDEDVEVDSFYRAFNCLRIRKKECPLFAVLTRTEYEFLMFWATVLKLYKN